MSYELILMPYKENCKAEGEILTRIKIIRMYFIKGISKKEISEKWRCNKNTITNIMKLYKLASSEAKYYLENNINIPSNKLDLFNFLENDSRKPKSHSRCLNKKEERVIIEKHANTSYGAKRIYRHLERQKFNMDIYTLAKIKGVYKRNELKVKKKRTANGNRRPLYDYDAIEAFEFLQYDTKHILDLKALPADIYEKFKKHPDLPLYQWTIVDAKTKVRFLAWSHDIDSFFGFKFLELVIVWLRSHNVNTKINVQFDGGYEFCCASKRKLDSWNEKLEKYDVEVYDTDGSKWKQNLVERTHRIDDEEFYCPRGEFIDSKNDFLKEAQFWIIYYNNRSSDSIGLSGITPKEKLEKLGYYNARDICNFPCIILDDYFRPLSDFFEIKKSQNVLTYYRSN